ncbi:MAG: 6,7-dimethyl-8-ribityllumazine synthase [Parvibaculales bacterium]
MMSKKILIIEARFYAELADALAQGAVAELESAEYAYERVAVPGVLEVPVAINYAAASGDYAAYIALGVVIRGETTHYEIVCNESARGLMDLGIKNGLAIGNGIQTVENEAQAWARCRINEKNKGGGAAQAALRLLELRQHWMSK